MRVRKVLKRAAVIIAALVLLPVVLFTAGVLWPERELAAVRTATPIAIVGVSILNPGEEIKAEKAAGSRRANAEQQCWYPATGLPRWGMTGRFRSRQTR